jgi:hypothetical protein
MFWIAPIVGAIAAGGFYKAVLETKPEVDIAGRQVPRAA